MVSKFVNFFPSCLLISLDMIFKADILSAQKDSTWGNLELFDWLVSNQVTSTSSHGNLQFLKQNVLVLEIWRLFIWGILDLTLK